MTNQTLPTAARTTDTLSSYQSEPPQRLDGSTYVLDRQANAMIAAMRGTTLNTSLKPITIEEGGANPFITNEDSDSATSPGYFPDENDECTCSEGGETTNPKKPGEEGVSQDRPTDLESIFPVTPDQISRDLDYIIGDPKVRDIAGDISTALTKGSEEEIRKALREIVMNNSEDTRSLERAAEAVVEAFAGHDIDLFMKVRHGHMMLPDNYVISRQGLIYQNHPTPPPAVRWVSDLA